MKKVLIITYYWPPSGGSGVQRWMYFSKYLPSFNIEPYIITVDEKKASYKFIDNSFLDKVKDIKVYKTKTIEPLRAYSKILGGDIRSNIPQGFSGEDKPNLFQKFSRFIRGNLFIPDARIGWNYFAYKKAKEIIETENINIVITTGPPHSTHLIGLKLKKDYQIKWISDFRDPWSGIYYNDLLYRSNYAVAKDKMLEREVLKDSDMVLTIGPSMRDYLREKIKNKEEKFYYIYNGYDADSFTGLIPNKTKNKFTICHIGILSNSQPITAFIKALTKMYSTNECICKFLKLQFVGRVSPTIIDEIKQHIPSIELELIEYLPHKDSLIYMINADLLFNSLAEMKDSRLLISGKLMEYIATGNPILCLGNPEGDAAFLLNEIENAKVFDRKNIDGIYNFILNIFNKWENNIKLSNKNFLNYSRLESTRKLSELINNLN